MPNKFTTIEGEVANLDLDPTNPRLPEDVRGGDQEALLRYFLENYDLEEIGWSMAEHGYFAEEPLLAVASPSDPDRLLVVEGNRRLSALRLLTSEDHRRSAGSPKVWNELAEFAEEHNLATIPVHLYEDRSDLVAYLGFRHVSGLMAWPAEAKARYIYALIRDHGFDFKRAAQAIGSRSDAIRRNFVAWSVIEQSRTAGVDMEMPVRRFGVFDRALQAPGIRGFLFGSSHDPWLEADESLEDPLQDEHGVERTEELINWIWGEDRVIRESRQLDDLAKVISDPGALEILRAERRLDVALDELPSDRGTVFAAIRLAYRNARRAYSEAHNFRGDSELIRETDALLDMARRVEEALAPATENG